MSISKILPLLFVFMMSHLSAESPAAKVAISGYDPVAYFNLNKAVRGTGFHTSDYKNSVYLFINEENKAKFEANPQKYLPQYGGYCAFGMALDKDFHPDPNIWKIVDGKLYLNLNKDIQAKWEADLNSQIMKADKNWASR